MRVLALDYGSARCGVAVSDPTGTLATPLEPVLAAGTRKGLRRVAQLVDELGAERVVVGLPVSLSGGDSRQKSCFGCLEPEAAERDLSRFGHSLNRLTLIRPTENAIDHDGAAPG